MNIEIRTIPQIRVAYICKQGSYPVAAKQAWDELCACAGPAGLLGPQTGFFGISHDDPTVTDEENLRYDACISLPRDSNLPQGLQIQNISEGRYAVYMHKGSYSGLFAAYQKIFRDWLPTSGERLCDKPCFEKYLSDCQTTPEDELLTEIHIPLQ